MGIFKKIKKALKFEAFNVKGIVKKIAKNPQRLLVGAVDPIGTKIANTVLGTKWKPAVNQLGGATKETFAEAEAKGMDTGLSKSLHAVAGVVAGIWGGAALGNLASTGASQLSAGANVAGNTAAATNAGAVGGDITPVAGAAAPAAADAGAASGVIEPVTVTATKVGTAAPASGGMLSTATKVAKGAYDFAKSSTGQTIIGTALQGYAQGKQKEAEQKYDAGYRRAFTPEELAAMGSPSVPGGYLDRARRVSDFLSDRGVVNPQDPNTVAGYARGGR